MRNKDVGTKKKLGEFQYLLLFIKSFKHESAEHKKLSTFANWLTLKLLGWYKLMDCVTWIVVMKLDK